MSMLEVTGLRKVYASRLSANKVEALKNVNFTVEEGEYVAIMGESGSGKTTLLNILAALDRPTAGTVTLDGQDFARLRESAVSAYRRDHLGFVFQEFNLLDTFTLEDNIFLPLVLAGKPHWEMRSRLLPIAAQLGIADILSKYPYEVSGGQKQRVAIARALVNSPAVLLADEPSGNLDTRNKEEVRRLFFDLRERLGQTIVLVTHDESLALRADRRIVMSDGLILPE